MFYKFLLRAHISARATGTCMIAGSTNWGPWFNPARKKESLAGSALSEVAVFLSPFPFLPVEPLRQIIFGYELANKQDLCIKGNFKIGFKFSAHIRYQ